MESIKSVPRPGSIILFVLSMISTFISPLVSLNQKHYRHYHYKEKNRYKLVTVRKGVVNTPHTNYFMNDIKPYLNI